MQNVVIHCYSKIGNFCVLNTSSTIDHECEIGNGVHIMGGGIYCCKSKNYFIL